MRKKRAIVHFSCMRTALIIANNNRSKACRILDIPLKKKISIWHDKEDRPIVYPLTRWLAMIPEREGEYKEEYTFYPVYYKREPDTIGKCFSNLFTWAFDDIPEKTTEKDIDFRILTI